MEPELQDVLSRLRLFCDFEGFQANFRRDFRQPRMEATFVVSEPLPVGFHVLPARRIDAWTKRCGF